MNLKQVVRCVLIGAAAVSGAARAEDEITLLEDLIVTAQKREENVQQVPIAVTALNRQQSDIQLVRTGADLQRMVPNMNFSRLLGSEVNFQLRGIGYQLVATAGDAGVGVHINNVPQSVTRIADAEFFDLERIEILRGPQGTLYGRNATGGVLNVLTAKPVIGQFSGGGSLEYGEYSAKKGTSVLNIPMGSSVALRLAGTWLKRDGFTENLYDGSFIDGRDLWSGRATLLVSPSDAFSMSVRAERFSEDDNRIGHLGAKDACIKDPGPTSVGGVATDGGGTASRVTQSLLSRGCLSGSIYSPQANGSENYIASLSGQLGYLGGFIGNDIYAGVTQSPDWRQVSIAPIPYHAVPSYAVTNDIFELNLEFKFDNGLKATSLTAYTEDELTSKAAGASYSSNIVFNNVANIVPNGVFNDPQIGPTGNPRVLDIQHNVSDQLSTELRLQSAFEGVVNFNAGGIYMRLNKTNDRFIVTNARNAYVTLANLVNGTANALSSCNNPVGIDCYIDPNPFPDGSGHNYFVSHVPYKLTAAALFGELYVDLSDAWRLTTGVRYTDDKKEILLHPSNLLVSGSGYSPNLPVEQSASWKEVTGRMNIDWRVTENSMLYASYSKGYKGGGINNPSVTKTSPSYDPEFVNAYEIGSKNAFANGKVLLNLTGFAYQYDGYQISQLRGLVSTTENIDAKIKGAELEFAWKPIADLRFDLAAGWLDTGIVEGTSIDTFDRIQGQTGVTFVKGTSDACIAPTAQLAALIASINSGATPRRAILGVCSGAVASVTPSIGNPVNLADKELPQSPHLTTSVGAEYRLGIGGGWTATLRGDYYHQSDAYTRVYNTESDELRAWGIVNASLTFASESNAFAIQLYGKNIQDKDIVTGYIHNSDQLSLTRSVMLADPRLWGLKLSVNFGGN